MKRRQILEGEEVADFGWGAAGKRGGERSKCGWF
jgi:hypothetical protein